MALSGSASVQVTDNVALVFSWTAVQDATAWQSTVDWLLQLVSNDIGRIDATSESPNTVTVDGLEITDAANIGIGNNETKTLESGQVVLDHNADGTRSFDYSFSQVCNITVGNGYVGTVSGSGTGELDTLTADSGDSGDPGDTGDTGDTEDPDDSTILLRKRSFVNFYLLGRCGKPYPFGKGQQWETTCDEEVTTTYGETVSNPGGYYNSKLSTQAVRLMSKNTYRVTLDGNVYVLDSVYHSGIGYALGNRHLQNSEKYEDTGLDFFISSDFFYTRNPGAYTLKIERLVKSDG